MSADTITTTQLDDLIALLDTARQTIRRIRLQAEQGEISPVEAAETVRETAETINRFCQP